MKKKLEHICDPNLSHGKIIIYSSIGGRDEPLHEALQEDIKKFAIEGCGKCIVELFKAVIATAHTEDDKLDTLNWLLEISDIKVPDYIIDEKRDSIVEPICDMILDNKDWDKCNPVLWLRKEIRMTELNKTQPNANPERESVRPLDFKGKENKFNKVPLIQVYNYFSQLSENSEEPFLTSKEVLDFVERAFCHNKTINKLEFINIAGKKGVVWKLFHNFFEDCTNSSLYEPTKHTKEKYVRLITDNFTNWEYYRVYNNFANADSKYWKRLKDFK